MNKLNSVLSFLKTLPGKVVLWILIAGTIAIIVLQYMAKSATLKAKDMNLNALINDALAKLKISQNKDKIADLDKKPKKEELEKDPDKVVDFYKDRK